MLTKITNEELRHIEKVLDNERSKAYDILHRYESNIEDLGNSLLFIEELKTSLNLLRIINNKIADEWESRDK